MSIFDIYEPFVTSCPDCERRKVEDIVKKDAEIISLQFLKDSIMKHDYTMKENEKINQIKNIIEKFEKIWSNFDGDDKAIKEEYASYWVRAQELINKIKEILE